MAKPDIDRKKVEALLAAAVVPMQQLTAIFEELRVVTEGGPSIGDQLAEYYHHWGEMHSAAGYQGAYVWNYKVDVPHVKRFLKSLGKDELFARVERYHRDADWFLKKARHPHSLFVSGINRYATAETSELSLEIAPVGCKHTPACTSDQEHTRRMITEQVS